MPHLTHDCCFQGFDLLDLSRSRDITRVESNTEPSERHPASFGFRIFNAVEPCVKKFICAVTEPVSQLARMLKQYSQ